MQANGFPSLVPNVGFPELVAMPILSATEFKQMESLMAGLLPSCCAEEEAQLLRLHARLQAIYVAQAGLQESRDRLMALAAKSVKAG